MTKRENNPELTAWLEQKRETVLYDFANHLRSLCSNGVDISITLRPKPGNVYVVFLDAGHYMSSAAYEPEYGDFAEWLEREMSVIERIVQHMTIKKAVQNG